MAAPTEISAARLARLIAPPDCRVLRDMRTDEDHDADPRLIPGARGRPHDARRDLPSGARALVICHMGLKLSQGAAALLRRDGVRAKTLDSAAGWRAAGLPTAPSATIGPRDAQGRTLLVTRARPKIDRIACPWLIGRFLDRFARFLFLAPSQAAAVAERFDAQPSDIEGVFWSPRGDACTFDTMLAEFGLEPRAPARMATVIRGAATNRHDLAPEAAGLMAAALGLSRMLRDDLDQLEAGMTLFDAFYRWARDASAEGHDWPAAAARP